MKNRVLGFVFTALAWGAAIGAAAAAPGFSVRGNLILDPAGKPFLIRGVDRPSLEWESKGDHLSPADFQKMSQDWHANTVRIALDQDFWLKGAARYDPTYRQRVMDTVREANAAGLLVILDLHWSDKGNLADPKPGQQKMADENSVQFWREAADTFRSWPDVMFELYNEPHDVSWDIWQHGGDTGDGWKAVGMQQLIDAVRHAHAANVVIVGGLAWSSDLTGVETHPLKGRGIAYATHQYADKGDRPNPDWWTRSFGKLSARVPIIVTEFGDYDDNPAWQQAFLDYLKDPLHESAPGAPPVNVPGRSVGWTAWAWYPGGQGFPSIIRNWNGDPTRIGAVVQAELSVPVPPAGGMRKER